MRHNSARRHAPGARGYRGPRRWARGTFAATDPLWKALWRARFATRFVLLCNIVRSSRPAPHGAVPTITSPRSARSPRPPEPVSQLEALFGGFAELRTATRLAAKSGPVRGGHQKCFALRCPRSGRIVARNQITPLVCVCAVAPADPSNPARGLKPPRRHRPASACSPADPSNPARGLKLGRYGHPWLLPSSRRPLKPR